MNEHNFKIAASIGGRKEQQDFAGAVIVKFGLLVVVCDGMGGAKGGATASNMAVNIIMHDIATANYPTPAEALRSAIAKANAEIFRRSRNEEDFRGMGTTATAIIIQREKATVAHVGDSRVYQLRYDSLIGKGARKVFRTNDHSKVFELVKRGILTEEQARTSSESNVILRALGIQPQADVEISDDLPYLRGDRFLLCTDGVCGALPEEDLLQLLNEKRQLEGDVAQLIAAVDDAGFKSGGGHDNLTAALIECNSDSTLKTKMDMNSKILIASLSTLLIISLGYIGYTQMKGKPSVQQNDAALVGARDSLQKATELTDSLMNVAIAAKPTDTPTHAGPQTKAAAHARKPNSVNASGSAARANVDNPNAAPKEKIGEDQK